MVTLKGVKQVRTMRQVKSYRSCPTATGLPMWGAELGRMGQEEVARGRREQRRCWLAVAWGRHRRRF
ncbi:MAG TPA: hypothetical protein VE082_06340 [Desulfobaccales bacterium]|nr:hypothetical protein [Desulfobaccales bacterium]